MSSPAFLRSSSKSGEFYSSVSAGKEYLNPSDVPLNCVSSNGNNSEQYQSVAYCSKYSDITDQLIISSTASYALNLDGSFNCSQPLLNLNLSLPSRLFANVQGPCEGPCDYVNMTLFTASHTGRSGNSNDIRRGLLFLRKDCSDPGMKDSWSCSSLGYGAAECELYPCVRSYKGTRVM